MNITNYFIIELLLVPLHANKKIDIAVCPF